MRKMLLLIGRGVVLGVAIALSACSGGGSGQPPVQISGIAANGAGFVGGVVYVFDSTGRVVGQSSTIDSTGQYSLSLADGAVAPFVLVATRETAEGQNETMVSIVSSADQTTANITPITSLIASLLSTTGDPAQLAADLAAGTATVSAASIAAAITEINTALAPLLDATATSTDPLSGTFTADGTGYDRLLDSLSVSFTPSAGNTTTVDLTVKTASTDTSEPTTISYNSGNASSIPVLPTVDATTLVAPGTSDQITKLLARMNACYQVELAARVSGSTILDSACNGLFYLNDPSKYKHNSYTVSPTGAFKGIFSAPKSANVTFERPRYEYTVKTDNTDATKPITGDVVFTASWSDVNGNSDTGEFWARPNNTGALYLIGNLSGIDADVSARVELREYLHADMQQYTHINVGFSIFVNSKHSSLNGLAVDHIIATSPKGNTIKLKRATAGFGYYEIMKSDGTTSRTSVVKLAGQYLSPPTEGAKPRTVVPDVWANACAPDVAPCDWSDTQIAEISPQGVWKFEAYSDAEGTNLIATFRRRTTNRPLTLAEASQVKWPALIDSVKADARGLITIPTPPGSDPDPRSAYIPIGNTADYVYIQSGTIAQPADGWGVPTGASWVPTNAKVFGLNIVSGSAQGFDDIALFRSTARRARISCSTQPGGFDTHCDPTVTDKFKAGVRVNQLQLNGRNAQRLNFSVSYRTQASF